MIRRLIILLLIVGCEAIVEEWEKNNWFLWVNWRDRDPPNTWGHPPVYMLYATLTQNGEKGWLIGQKVDLGVNWKDKKDINGNVVNQASLSILAYGNAFDKEDTTASHWGDEKLSIPNMPEGVTEYDFGIVEGSFLADNTATGNIQFQVDSGEWYVSDVQIKSATDTAFNPDFVKVSTPVPPLLQRPDRIRFLVEFFDVNNNIADSIIFSDPFTFNGPNINISGDNNILSGSMVIGSALGSGIEMAGVNSGYIRSIG